MSRILPNLAHPNKTRMDIYPQDNGQQRNVTMINGNHSFEVEGASRGSGEEPLVTRGDFITSRKDEFHESPFPTGCRKSGTRGTRPSEGCEFCTDKQCTLVHQESITTACMISTIVAPSDVVGSLTVTEAP